MPAWCLHCARMVLFRCLHCACLVLSRFRHSVGIVPARCRYGALGFFQVGVLMLTEVDDLDEAASFRFVSEDEWILSRRQGCKEGFRVAGIVGKDLCLDPRGPVFEAPLPVRHAPEPLEEDPRQRIFGREFLIFEKTRLDVTCPHVGSFPQRCFEFPAVHADQRIDGDPALGENF